VISVESFRLKLVKERANEKKAKEGTPPFSRAGKTATLGEVKRAWGGGASTVSALVDF
jgi:hypothetical protein